MSDCWRPEPGTLIEGDCLDVAAGMPGGWIDLCYLDPPFGTGRTRSGAKLSLGRGGRARSPSEQPSLSFDDAFASDSGAYIDWLEPRIEAIARLLKPTGSLLVHLDWRMSHYVKILLDGVMGPERFVNEIIWFYSSGGGRPGKRLARKHDVILWYSRGKRFTCNLEAASLPRNICPACGEEKRARNHMKKEIDQEGRVIRSIRSGGKTYRYFDDAPAVPCDVWLDISHLQQRDPERTGYPTQKPLTLLKRVVTLCSSPGDLVADFFMGTGTTLVAAAQNGRQWLGCDRSREAVALARERLEKVSAEPRLVNWSEVRFDGEGSDGGKGAGL